MRKSIWMAGLAALVSIGVLHAQTAAGKVDVQWKCAAPSPVHAVPVGDVADHAYIVQQVKCTAAKGELAGVKEKDGTGTEFVEATGNNGKGHGIFVATLANGDKVNYTYTFTGVSSNSKLQTGTNKWAATSGSGKFKGITASGTCTAKGAADGGAVFDCVGTYTIPK
ncbi:MAG TPA: hypothetical protein VES67_07555 [Vicinamibacterales bacterium]|nr:hypothetical protein [Vicinamibacterales bacterium]